MAEKKKQDWTTRIHDVWVLMKTVDGDSEVDVYLTEELLLDAMVKEMMKEIAALEPYQQAQIRRFLDVNDFSQAAIEWADATNVSYSWNEHPIIRE